MAPRTSTGVLDGIRTLQYQGTMGLWSDRDLLQQFLDRSDSEASNAACAAILDRHGPMVLHVCRQLLQCSPDVEDAFQATFLVLIQRAGSIRKPESLGSWLYGIAVRVARQARKQAAARRSAMARLAERSKASERSEPAGTLESRAPELIEEVERLPDRLRTPIVLHCFQGMTAEAIAARVGCRRGTVLSRLARARARLKSRLENREGALILLPSLESVRLRALPQGLAANTVRACSSLGLAGSLAGGSASETAATLTAATLKGMATCRLRFFGVLWLMVILPVVLGGSWLLASSGSRAVAPSEADDAKQVTADASLAGQVVDSDGKPVAGARVYLAERSRREPPGIDGRARATTNAEGRFRCPASREELAGGKAIPGGRAPGVQLIAQAESFGPAWTPLDATAADRELKITLCRDDVPIVGRVLNQEGQPVAGASVVAEEIYALADPGAFARDLRKSSGRINADLQLKLTNYLRPRVEDLIPRTKSDADGRFTLHGVGRDRAASLRFEGPTIETDYRLVFTKAGPIYRPELGQQIEPELIVLGPRFELKVSPGRVIEGSVLDLERGTPIAGARVFSSVVGFTTTDAKGRYRLSGQPLRAIEIDMETPDEPYMKASRKVAADRAAGPLRTDFRLKRGIWLRGRVVDQKTNRPLRAQVLYLPLSSNPALVKPADEAWRNTRFGHMPSFRTDELGQFRAPVLPGPGLLIVQGPESGYVRRKAPDLARTPLSSEVSSWIANRVNAIQEINPEADKETPAMTLCLEPLSRRMLRLVDPSGKPVEGTDAVGTIGDGFHIEHTTSAEILHDPPEPGKARTLLFVHRTRNLGGFHDVIAEDPEPLDLVLQPTGTIIGRLLDEKGNPLAGYPIRFEYLRRHEARGMSWLSYPLADGLTTDGDGRFRITCLVPGITYRFLSFGRKPADFRDPAGKPRLEWKVPPGETQDWGEARIRE